MRDSRLKHISQCASSYYAFQRQSHQYTSCNASLDGCGTHHPFRGMQYFFGVSDLLLYSQKTTHYSNFSNESLGRSSRFTSKIIGNRLASLQCGLNTIPNHPISHFLTKVGYVQTQNPMHPLMCGIDSILHNCAYVYIYIYYVFFDERPKDAITLRPMQSVNSKKPSRSTAGKI